MRYKILFFLLFLSTFCFTQEEKKFSAWGTAGIGISSFRFTNSYSAISGNFGLAFRYEPITVKYKRNVSTQVILWDKAEQILTHEVLFGYAFNILQQNENEETFTDSKLCVSVGLGTAEYVSRDSLISWTFFSNDYRMKSESSTAFPVEIEFEFYLIKYVGVSLNVYAVVSKFTPVFGSNFCIRIGYL